MKDDYKNLKEIIKPALYFGLSVLMSYGCQNKNIFQRLIEEKSNLKEEKYYFDKFGSVDEFNYNGTQLDIKTVDIDNDGDLDMIVTEYHYNQIMNKGKVFIKIYENRIPQIPQKKK